MGSTARGRARSETLTPSSLPAAPCHTKRFSLPDVAIAPKPHFNALAHCFPFVSERDVDRQARACGQSLPDLSIDWPRYAESERSDVLDLPPSLNQADVPLLLTHLDMILHRDHRRLSECMDVNQLYTLTGDDIPSIPQPESRTSHSFCISNMMLIFVHSDMGRPFTPGPCVLVRVIQPRSYSS